jgi:very-short-patch-repair endonuclease
MSKHLRRAEPRSALLTKSRAQQLRQIAPFSERILWSLLRGRRLNGRKFRRQQPVGPYVADFFCEATKLVIELDGESHGDRQTQDRARDEYMRQRGLIVLRIPNDELLTNKEGVLETILRVVPEKTRPNASQAPNRPHP